MKAAAVDDDDCLRSGASRIGVRTKGRAKVAPDRRNPATHRGKNREADGQDHAQKRGVFDEGRAVVISVKGAEERGNRFHVCSPYLSLQTPVRFR